MSETDAVIFALNLYASSNLDFVDCLLTGYVKVNGHHVLTFDSALKKELAEKAYIL